MQMHTSMRLPVSSLPTNDKPALSNCDIMSGLTCTTNIVGEYMTNVASFLERKVLDANTIYLISMPMSFINKDCITIPKQNPNYSITDVMSMFDRNT